MRTFESDLCIIGAGAAGLQIAHSLKGSGLKVRLLESGFKTFDYATQALGHFENSGLPIRQSSQPYDLNTLADTAPYCRMYGGTLQVWQKRCSLPDPIDFQKRPEIPFSGWPISFDELLPYLRKTALQLGVEALFSLDTSSKAWLRTDFEPLEFPAVCGGSAVRLVLRSDKKQIDHLLVRSLNGEEWQERAERFILACGTIENTRLLLASGFQSFSPWLGRNLLDHPKGVFGMIEIAEEPFSFCLPEDLLRKEKLPNHRFDLSMPPFFRIHLDQMPSQTSHIELSNQKNALGEPRAKVDWHLSNEDRVNAVKAIRLACASVEERGLGKVKLRPEIETLDFLEDASHHLGTTRMGETPEEGVVDRNCKFFGIDNFYIAGNSLFPTAGNAYPTLILLALAERLADHLKESR